MEGNPSNMPFREHHTVKNTALVLFVLLVSISVVPLDASNYWNVAILWFAAYVIMVIAWKPKRNVEPMPFREHWGVKSISLILSFGLTVIDVILRKHSSVWNAALMWLTAFVVMVIVWKPRAITASSPQLGLQEEEEKKE